MRKTGSPTKGKLLLAHPFLLDPNFHRSVIFLAEHNEEGSIGFILNKPLEISLSEAVESFPKNIGASLFLGGPVQQGTLHFLHKLGDDIEGAIEVADGIFWGGDFKTLKNLIESNEIKSQDLRFFIGYAGWGNKQLQCELDENSWIVVNAKTEDVFQHSQNNLWSGILREMGGKYAILANAPGHPSLN